MSRFLQILFGKPFLFAARGHSSILSVSFFFLHWRKSKKEQAILIQSSDSPTDMKKTLVEFDQVLSLANHNSELAKKLLLAFLSELKSAVEVFRESPNEEDMVAVSKLSHKIKPSLQLLQVESMNQVMNLYKMKYREGSVVAKAELPTIFHQIQSLYQEIVKEIEEYIRTTAQ